MSDSCDIRQEEEASISCPVVSQGGAEGVAKRCYNAKDVITSSGNIRSRSSKFLKYRLCFPT